MTLQWSDIALHVVVTLALYGIIYWLGWDYLGVTMFNTVLFPARELWQHRKEPMEIFTRTQPFLEWTVPVAAGLLLYGVL